jgi:hypothetical protein
MGFNSGLKWLIISIKPDNRPLRNFAKPEVQAGSVPPFEYFEVETNPKYCDF